MAKSMRQGGVAGRGWDGGDVEAKQRERWQ
jgi:hypothetical protein